MKLLALVLFVAAIPAMASDISGVWLVHGTVGGNPISAICNLKQEADVLTGSCKLDDNQLVDVAGTVNGDQAMWQSGLDDGGTMLIISFQGTVSSASEMKGQIFVDPFEMQGDFTAKLHHPGDPEEKLAPPPPPPADAAAKPTQPPATLDPGKNATLYVVPYAHLDTEWRWEYPNTIGEYLPRTMRDNFALFEKYPHYIFNFSGANRYRLMKEYYPADYETLKKYVAAGRWFVAGSSMEEGDVNNPSAESIIRQILYGKEYFRNDFGKTSAEYMLPDCFGFPASLPSILAHVGIKGFSTQKLTWHSATTAGGPGSPQDTPKGIPFNVGVWQGPDGKASSPPSMQPTIAVTSPRISPRAMNGSAVPRTTANPADIYVDYRYYGTGDIGGAPRENSVKLMEAIVTKGTATLPSERNATAKSEPVKVGDGPLHVDPDKFRTDVPRHQAGRCRPHAALHRRPRTHRALCRLSDLRSLHEALESRE